MRAPRKRNNLNETKMIKHKTRGYALNTTSRQIKTRGVGEVR